MRFAVLIAAVAVVGGIRIKAKDDDEVVAEPAEEEAVEEDAVEEEVIAESVEAGVLATTIEDMMTEQLGEAMGGIVADQILDLAEEEGVEMLTDQLDNLVGALDADCEMVEDECVCTTPAGEHVVNAMICNEMIGGLIDDAADRAQDFVQKHGEKIIGRASRWFNRGG